MLDHADFIARYDTQNALGVAGTLGEQLRHEFDRPLGLEAYTGITSIVVAGMGGSAQGAEFLKTWLSGVITLPLEIIRDYSLPAYIGPSTLVIASSYSGNTEESVGTLSQAIGRGAKVVVVASGGQLLEAAVAQTLPYYALPVGLQPRFAVLYVVKALSQLFDALGITREAATELSSAGEWISGKLGAWSAGVATADNPAKQIAGAIVGHSVVMYAGPALAFAAQKWKIAFNENAKNIAFYNVFPELNHNEFTGWLHPAPNGLKVIELRSDFDHPRVQKRFDVTNRLLSAQFAPIQVQADGQSPLAQLVWTIALGEHVATYLAILNQTDPTPVDLVERFKSELKQ